MKTLKFFSILLLGCIGLFSVGEIHAASPNVVISGPDNITYSSTVVTRFLATGIPSDATVKWEVNKKTLSIRASGRDYANIAFASQGNSTLKDTLKCLVTTGGTTYTFRKIFTITPAVAQISSSVLSIWQGYLRVPANTTMIVPEGKQLAIHGYVSFEQGSKLVIEKGSRVEFNNNCNIVSPQNRWKGIQINKDPSVRFPENFGFIYKHTNANLPRTCTGGLAGTESVYFNDGIPIEERQFFWNQALTGNVRLTNDKVFNNDELIINPSATFTIEATLYMKAYSTITIKGASGTGQAGGALILETGLITSRDENSLWGGIRMDISDGTNNPAFRVADECWGEIKNASTVFRLTGRAASNSGYDNMIFNCNELFIDNCAKFIIAKNIRFSPNTGFLREVAAWGISPSLAPTPVDTYIDLENVHNFAIDRYNYYNLSQKTLIKLKNCTNFSLLNSELSVLHPELVLKNTAINSENSEITIENCKIEGFALGVYLSNGNRTNISSNYFSNNKINIQAHAGFDNTRLMISNNEFMHMGQATQSLHFLNINNITIFDNDFTVNDDANGNPDVKGIYLSYTHPNLNECAEIIKNRIKVCSPIVVNGFNKNTKIRCNEISSLEITEGRYGYTADQYGLGDQGAPNSPAGNSSMYIYNNSNLFTYYASYDDSVYGWNIDVIRSPGTPNCSTGCTAPYSLVESRFSSLLEQTDNSQGADQFTSLDSIEPDTQTLMKITPNPNNGKIRLVLGSDINKTDVSREISIYNLSGALIHTEKLQDKETEIEMARLFSAGTYICTLKVDGKVIGKATAIVK